MTDSSESKNSGDDQGGWFSNLFSRAASEGSLRDSLEEAIDEHEEDSDARKLGAEERAMLFNIVEFGELRVEDVMVPRADIVAIDTDIAFDDLVTTFADAAHSRLPVYRESLDEVHGMVHVKDVLNAISSTNEGDAPTRVSGIQRSVLFVPVSMRVMDLLARMRSTRTHMAIVVDEYGGTDGLVTIEDLVEEIVGEIEDEHDEEDEIKLVRLTAGRYDADARIEISELEETLDIVLVEDDVSEEVDTLGGLVFMMAGQVPEIGDVIDHPSGYRFEVVDCNPRRIIKIRIHPGNVSNLEPIQESGAAESES